MKRRRSRLFRNTMFGVDVAVPVSAAQWSCLMAANVTWASVRAWHSTGSFDENAPSNLAAAASAGLQDVDLYLFPCRALPAEFQVSSLIASLSLTSLTNPNRASYGTIWLDIEANPSRTHATHQNCSWAEHTPASNCEYVRMLADAVAARNIDVGVYSSHHSWLPILGADCTAMQGLPLWYPHYDRQPGCADYADYPFGGWTRPRWKQFTDKAGTAAIGACGVPVDTSARCSDRPSLV